MKVYKPSKHEGHIRHYEQEVASLSLLDHPNIVELRDHNPAGSFTEADGRETEVKYTVFNMAENGNLLSHVRNQAQDDSLVRIYFK